MLYVFFFVVFFFSCMLCWVCINCIRFVVGGPSRSEETSGDRSVAHESR